MPRNAPPRDVRRTYTGTSTRAISPRHSRAYEMGQLPVTEPIYQEIEAADTYRIVGSRVDQLEPSIKYHPPRRTIQGMSSYASSRMDAAPSTATGAATTSSSRYHQDYHPSSPPSSSSSNHHQQQQLAAASHSQHQSTVYNHNTADDGSEMTGLSQQELIRNKVRQSKKNKSYASKRRKPIVQLPSTFFNPTHRRGNSGNGYPERPDAPYTRQDESSTTTDEPSLFRRWNTNASAAAQQQSSALSSKPPISPDELESSTAGTSGETPVPTATTAGVVHTASRAVPSHRCDPILPEHTSSPRSRNQKGRLDQKLWLTTVSAATATTSQRVEAAFPHSDHAKHLVPDDDLRSIDSFPVLSNALKASSGWKDRSHGNVNNNNTVPLSSLSSQRGVVRFSNTDTLDGDPQASSQQKHSSPTSVMDVGGNPPFSYHTSRTSTSTTSTAASSSSTPSPKPKSILRPPRFKAKPPKERWTGRRVLDFDTLPPPSPPREYQQQQRPNHADERGPQYRDHSRRMENASSSPPPTANQTNHTSADTTTSSASSSFLQHPPQPVIVYTSPEVSPPRRGFRDQGVEVSPIPSMSRTSVLHNHHQTNDNTPAVGTADPVPPPPLGHPAEKHRLSHHLDNARKVRGGCIADQVTNQSQYPDPPMQMDWDDDDTVLSAYAFIETVAAIVIQTAMRRFLARLCTYSMLDERDRSSETAESRRNSSMEQSQQYVSFDEGSISADQNGSRSAAETTPVQDQMEIRRQQEFEFYSLVAVKIQSVFRGFWTRDCLDVDHYCALAIQKSFRAYRCRTGFQRFVRKVIVAQSVQRGKVARAEASFWRQERQERDARYRYLVRLIHAQSVWRGAIARMQYGRLRQQRKDASERFVNQVVVVQSMCRRNIARDEAAHTLVHAILIQAAYRGHIVRRLYKRYLMLKEARTRVFAATVIQAKWRGYNGESVFIRTIVDVLIAQTIVRRWLALKRVDSVKKKSKRSKALKTNISVECRRPAKKIQTVSPDPALPSNHFLRSKSPDPAGRVTGQRIALAQTDGSQTKLSLQSKASKGESRVATSKNPSTNQSLRSHDRNSLSRENALSADPPGMIRRNSLGLETDRKAAASVHTVQSVVRPMVGHPSVTSSKSHTLATPPSSEKNNDIPCTPCGIKNKHSVVAYPMSDNDEERPTLGMATVPQKESDKKGSASDVPAPVVSPTSSVCKKKFSPSYQSGKEKADDVESCSKESSTPALYDSLMASDSGEPNTSNVFSMWKEKEKKGPASDVSSPIVSPSSTVFNKKFTPSYRSGKEKVKDGDSCSDLSEPAVENSLTVANSSKHKASNAFSMWKENDRKGSAAGVPTPGISPSSSFCNKKVAPSYWSGKEKVNDGDSCSEISEPAAQDSSVVVASGKPKTSNVFSMWKENDKKGSASEVPKPVVSPTSSACNKKFTPSDQSGKEKVNDGDSCSEDLSTPAVKDSSLIVANSDEAKTGNVFSMWKEKEKLNNAKPLVRK